MNLAVTIQKVVHNAVELLNVDECAVALLDNTGTTLLVLATSRAESGDERISFPLHQGSLAALAERRDALVMRDMHVDACMQPLAGDKTCTLICLPLRDGEQLMGVLTASSSTEDVSVPEQLRILTLLAEQAELLASAAREAELARHTSRTKSNFLSLVTHELRSPLNTINGYLDLILEGLAGEVNEQQREFICRARASSEHLYALLEDLLLTSRLDAGQVRLKRTLISLDDIVTAAVEELEVSALDGQITLATELAADLPPVLVDGTRLQQALRNLLMNALRFTPPGGRVTVSARVPPARLHDERTLVEVRVSDTGPGIAPEYHERIFERFFQISHPERGRLGGQGLGLSIVKMIVELHGGSIQVESALGVGSAFILTLDASRP